MFIRQLTIIIIFISSLNLLGQSTSDKYYKRMEGKIGENINVTANIVRLFDNVSGNYIYYYMDGAEDMYYGKTVDLNGKFFNNDSLNLKEFGSKEYTFRGLIKEGQYDGEWNVDNSKALYFNMKEYYPNGSLPFEVYYLNSESRLDKQKKDSPTAQIELTLVYPEGKYFQAGIIDSVQKIIMDSYFGRGFKLSSPQQMLEDFEIEYFDNYKKQTEYRKETSPSSSLNYQKQVNMSVIYNSNYILCTEYIRYAYAGGAHGMSNISYDIVDLDSGLKLGYEDIFDQESDSLLSIVLTQQLRLNYQIPDEISLAEAGFFVEEVKPNKNLFVNGEGIGFVYNSY
ncbi:MAG: hypothetical protein C0598_06620 [Marinilabiliales bacterium]|nr:MAG: hypothetical protein C0598_06620 [Marinilabiliales bacterium]